MRLMYFLYSFLFYLILPALLIRLYWRSCHLPAYRKGLLERLGYYHFNLQQCIWVHAVSLGEVNAALPLIHALRELYPSMPILVTTTTPTGKERIKTTLGDKVFCAYLPFDLPSAIKRFLSVMHPQIAIIMEREWWPNLLTYCHQYKIPVFLMNARLSPQSAAAYHRISSLTKNMLKQIKHIAAQSADDAARLIGLGAQSDDVSITGNIKFDLTCPTHLKAASEDLRKILGKERFVWIAASTHEGEEEIILAVHQQIREVNPNALLILVPRHPDRFELVGKASRRLFATGEHSKRAAFPPSSEIAVYLGDTMGELLLYYGAADVAFVGGSLVDIGGHNLLEPALLSKPILTGTYLYNFAEIKALFVAASAMFIVDTPDELVKKLTLLNNDTELRHVMGQNAFSLIEQGRGALDKKIKIIQSILNDTEPDFSPTALRPFL